MNLLSQFKTSLFSECNAPNEFGRVAAQHDNEFEVSLTDNEIVPLYAAFFERDKIVSFNVEEWREFITSYYAHAVNIKST